MKSVYDMPREEFLKELDKRVTPALVYQMASDIYLLLQSAFCQNCNDSLLREWAFDWASEKLSIDYDTIYKRWLGL